MALRLALQTLSGTSPWKRSCDVIQLSRRLNLQCGHSLVAVSHRYVSSSSDHGPDLMEVEDTTRPKYRENNRRKPGNFRENRNTRNPGYNYGLEGKAKYSERRFDPVEPKGEFIFGVHPVLLAMKHKRRVIHTIYIHEAKKDKDLRGEGIDEVVSLAEEMEIPIEWCIKSKMNYMSYQRTHQGVIMDSSKLEYKPCASLKTDESTEHGSRLPALWLVLMSVHDPMNFGAILRSAYYLGTEKVVTFNCCDLSPVVSKSSAGAVELMDVYTTNDLPSFVSEQKARGKHVLGSVGKSTGAGDPEYSSQEIQLKDTVLSADSLLLIGNEGEGVSEDLLRLCDQLITIPEIQHSSAMNINSLNVSVAAAIMQHHLLSTRNTNEPE